MSPIDPRREFFFQCKHLVVDEGLTMLKAAERLGVNRSTVTRVLHRGGIFIGFKNRKRTVSEEHHEFCRWVRFFVVEERMSRTQAARACGVTKGSVCSALRRMDIKTGMRPESRALMKRGGKEVGAKNVKSMHEAKRAAARRNRRLPPSNLTREQELAMIAAHPVTRVPTVALLPTSATIPPDYKALQRGDLRDTIRQGIASTYRLNGTPRHSPQSRLRQAITRSNRRAES